MTREELQAVVVTSPHAKGRNRQMIRLNGIEDYLFIGGPRAYSNSQAAKRLGVAKRTVERWRAALRGEL